ncbi:heparan-alpha-glucosaminide N-acetyltransferase-like [Oscarella lobularis]|uniref:heparan-alpha-glucosaminide N-acetyltransferase-like n=1 Tax=Oscarella lobularis TaxID=121494 RepID=UPI00331345E4
MLLFLVVLLSLSSSLAHDTSYSERRSHLGATEGLVCLENSLSHATVFVNSTSDDCYQCRPAPLLTVDPNSINCAPVDVDFKLHFVITWNDSHLNNSKCLKYIKIDEKGGLNITVVASDSPCQFVPIKGVWPYTPILVALAIYSTLAIAAFVYERLLKKRAIACCKSLADTESLVKSDLGNPEEARVNPDDSLRPSPPQQPENLFPVAKTVAQQRRRLRSLDTFRGLSLVIMIFVNYRGGDYWFFKHSKWNGLTVADLVFPWFDFILGTSAAISLNSLDRRDVSRWRILLKALRRFVILFALGIIISSNDGGSLPTLRIPGVLQRLAISYLGVTLMHLILAPKRDRNADKVFAPVREIVNHWAEWLVALCLIALWAGLTFLLHVPNCPTGYLGPGGLYGDDNGKNHNCTGGAAGYIDSVLFKKHVYPHPTCKELYGTGPYDPEGTLGTLTSIFLAFLGVHAGRVFLTHRDDGPRLKRLIIAGIIAGAIGTGLAEGKQNGGLIPINKNLWSLSYVLVMAGTAYLLLSLCYFVIDVKKFWLGGPFVYPGMNSILVYVGHELADGRFPFAYSWPGEANHANQLASSLIGMTLWVIIAYYLYVIDFFVKV